MEGINDVHPGLEHRNIHNLPQPDYSPPQPPKSASRVGLCEHRHPSLRTLCGLPAGHDGMWCISGPKEDPKAVAWPRPNFVKIKSVKTQQMSRAERRSMAKGGRGKLVKRSSKS